MVVFGTYVSSYDASSSVVDEIAGGAFKCTQDLQVITLGASIEVVSDAVVKYALYEYDDYSTNYAGDLIAESTHIVYAANTTEFSHAGLKEDNVVLRSGNSYYIVAMASTATGDCFIRNLTSGSPASGITATRTYSDGFASPLTGESPSSTRYIVYAECEPYPKTDYIGFSGSVKSNIMSLANRMRYTVQYAPRDGNLDKVYIYLSSDWTNTEEARCAIYKHSSNILVAQTAKFSGNSTEHWASVSFGPSSVTGGLNYKLIVWGDSNTKNFRSFRCYNNNVRAYEYKDITWADDGDFSVSHSTLDADSFSDGLVSYIPHIYATVTTSDTSYHIPIGNYYYKYHNVVLPTGPVNIEKRYVGTKVTPIESGYLDSICFEGKTDDDPTHASGLTAGLYATGATYASSLIQQAAVVYGILYSGSYDSPREPNTIRVEFSTRPYIYSGMRAESSSPIVWTFSAISSSASYFYPSGSPLEWSWASGSVV